MKIPKAPRRTFNVIATLVGTGLLVVLGLFLNTLFVSRTQQSPQPASQPQVEKLFPGTNDPRNALDKFLSYLHDGKYEKASRLYGGSYKVLEDYNPDISPQNRAKLLERWCTANGGMCLRHRILDGEATSEGRFVFTVRFFYEDKSIFKIGPPAGQEGKEIPGDSEFEVVKIKGSYRIMQLPPYSP